MKTKLGFDHTVAGFKPCLLLSTAIEDSGRSARKFAKLLGVAERTVRYWLADERRIPGPVLLLCALIFVSPTVIVDPEGAGELVSVEDVLDELRRGLDSKKKK